MKKIDAQPAPLAFEAERVTIVSDPGIDDLVALALLDRIAPDNAEFTVVSTYGNASAENTAQNARAFANFAGGRWMHLPGKTSPPESETAPEWPARINGLNGTWGVQPPRRNVQNEPQPQAEQLSIDGTLISLAPCTEVYRILNERKARPAGQLVEPHLVVMGGAFTVPGNVRPGLYAECNIGSDPVSAQSLFEKCDRQVSVVPLDVTNKVYWSLDQIASIPETTPTARWLKQLLGAWAMNYQRPGGKEKVFVLHDPLAVYLSVHPELAEWEQSGIAVVPDGIRRGQTVYADENPPCHIARHIPDPNGVASAIYNKLFSAES